MPSPQKAKGNSFERETAQYLSKLFGETFIRAPGSGAYVGGSNQKRKQFLHEGQVRSFKGDIVPGQSFPKLNAECKSYKDFPFHQLFSGQIKILDSWIEQCLEAADEGDFNIVFMKFNRKGKFVLFQSSDTTSFNLSNQFHYGFSKNNSSWIFMEYDTFFNLNKDQFKTACS